MAFSFDPRLELDIYGDPYWDKDLEAQLIPEPPDPAEDDGYDWHDELMDEMEQIDWEALEMQRKEEEAQLDAEEDAMVKAYGGDQPNFVSMRRQAIMKRR